MLDLIITSKTRRKVISVFTKYPDLKIHVRGLAKMIKEDPGNVQRELVRLERAGFVHGHKSANTKLYNVNPRFIFYRELQGLVLKSQTNKRPATL